MRFFITYLFLGAILLNTVSRLIIHVDFLINQEYIAENLCINKEQPVKQCNGSCQLKMELEKDDERKEKTVKHQVEIIPTIVSQEVYEFEQVAQIVPSEKAKFYTIQVETTGYNSSIFHPPTV